MWNTSSFFFRIKQIKNNVIWLYWPIRKGDFSNLVGVGYWIEIPPLNEWMTARDLKDRLPFGQTNFHFFSDVSNTFVVLFVESRKRGEKKSAFSNQKWLFISSGKWQQLLVDWGCLTLQIYFINPYFFIIQNQN